MTGIQDHAALLAAAKVWRLASRTFAAEMDAPFYRALRGLADAPRLRAMGLTPFDPGRPDDEDTALSTLAVEYCRLFIGPDPACPPYATHYLGGYARDRMQAFLDEFGLRVSPADDAPVLGPDHICVAFALLDQLYTTAAGQPATHLSPAQAATASRRLLGTYLPDWVPRFLHDVETGTREPPYRTIARLTALVFTDQARPAPKETDLLTVYTTSSCGYCRRLKTQLDRENIPYTDVDIERDAAAAAFVESVNGGNQTVPTVRCPNGSTMTNPTISQVKECLTLTGA